MSREENHKNISIVISDRLTVKGKVDNRYRKEKTCSRCGIKLTEKNWPINARKYEGKIWHICEDCFKIAIANSVYKKLRGIVLVKRPKSKTCELCDATKYQLSWHHWDDTDTSKGLWVCLRCHTIIENFEHKQDVFTKYQKLKQILENPTRTEPY